MHPILETLTEHITETIQDASDNDLTLVEQVCYLALKAILDERLRRASERLKAEERQQARECMDRGRRTFGKGIRDDPSGT